MLSGVTVLDLSRLLPGPYATRILADLGAEVIKIEDRQSGDYLCDFEPEWYEWLNRGKKILKLDLREAAGQEALFELVKGADALVEGFRPGSMERFGFAPPVLHRINPQLVIVSCTGFGQPGEWSQHAGHDLNYWAWSGLLELMPRNGVLPPNPPLQLSDLTGGFFAALGVVAGVLRARQTGESCHLDTSMVRSLRHFGGVFLAKAAQKANSGPGQSLSQDKWSLDGSLACYRTYLTADGRAVALGALETKFWEAFCRAINRPDLIPPASI